MDATVGAFEAKTHLSELLERAERGEEITITRRGVPVARLGPLPAAPPRLDAGAAAELVERFRAFRAKLRQEGVRPFTAEEIVDLVKAGRKY